MGRWRPDMIAEEFCAMAIHWQIENRIQWLYGKNSFAARISMAPGTSILRERGGATG